MPACPNMRTDLCQWYAYTDLYSSGYAGGVTDAFDLHSAKEKCASDQVRLSS